MTDRDVVWIDGLKGGRYRLQTRPWAGVPTSLLLLLGLWTLTDSWTARLYALLPLAYAWLNIVHLRLVVRLLSLHLRTGVGTYHPRPSEGNQ